LLLSRLRQRDCKRRGRRYEVLLKHLVDPRVEVGASGCTAKHRNLNRCIDDSASERQEPLLDVLLDG